MTEQEPPRLYGPMVVCRRFAETFRFYRDLLGLPATGGDGAPPWAEFAHGECHLVLLDRGFWEAAQGRPDAGAASPSSGPVVFSIQVADVDATHVRLQAAEVPVLQAPADRPMMGVRNAVVVDPEGTVVEINQKLTKPAR